MSPPNKHTIFFSQIFKTERGTEWFKTYVETAPFHSTKKVDTIISDVENLFAEKLEKGNKERAMERLRVPPFEEKLSSWTTFRLGLFLGIIFALVPFLILISKFFIHTKISQIKLENKIIYNLKSDSYLLALW